MFDATFLAGVLFSALLTASGLSWLRWGLRPQQFGCPDAAPQEPETVSAGDGQTETTESERPVTEPVPRVPWPPLAIFAVLFWVAFMILEQTAAEVISVVKDATPAPVIEAPAADEKNTESP